MEIKPDEKPDYSIYFLNGIAITLAIAIILSLNGIRLMQKEFAERREEQRIENEIAINEHLEQYNKLEEKWENYIVELDSSNIVWLPTEYNYNKESKNTFSIDDGTIIELEVNDIELNTLRKTLVNKEREITKVISINNYFSYFIDYSRDIKGEHRIYASFNKNETYIIAKITFHKNTIYGNSIETFISKLFKSLNGEYTDLINERLEEIREEIARTEQLKVGE